LVRTVRGKVFDGVRCPPPSRKKQAEAHLEREPRTSRKEYEKTHILRNIAIPDTGNGVGGKIFSEERSAVQQYNYSNIKNKNNSI